MNTIVLLGLMVILEANCGPVTINFYNIHDPRNIDEADRFAMQSSIQHMTTRMITLQLNSKAVQKFSFLKNIDVKGISMDGLVPAHNRTHMEARIMKDLEAFLSQASMRLLKALLNDDQVIPIEVTPSDDSFRSAMNFVHAFNYFTKKIDDACLVKVESFDPLLIPDMQKKLLDKLNKKASKPKPRSLPITVKNLFKIPQEYISELLDGVLSKERNHKSSMLIKDSVASFIAKKFHQFGLMVIKQGFQLLEFDVAKPPNGTNIIGILPGTKWGTSQDRPVIIGAHYDTVYGSPGLIDNASGTAAVLEIARVMARSDCTFEHSIFFVAFDLEETGIKGSTSFVKDLLLRVIIPEYKIREISGVFVLDCIGAWDTRNHTQIIPSGWSDVIPTIEDEISAFNHTGDFIGIYFRQHTDAEIVNKLDFYYHGLGKDKYRLQKLGTPELTTQRPSIDLMMRNLEFMRSDHASFWYPLEDYPSITLPGVLISDTGPFRGDMQKCYHEPCDTKPNITVNFEFMTKVAEAVAWSAADLAKGRCDSDRLHSVSEIFLLNPKH